ncbi:hypothetical protein BTZ20_3116 [Rhodococcus sp. MTM3W5.2]|nr:hypothetical protein BTZ20_3116 [Rhodococcus sp. MTM3W5.2]
MNVAGFDSASDGRGSGRISGRDKRRHTPAQDRCADDGRGP